ncbi:MAG: trypsin-like peptidase domain-containing protein [Patescibacteria group bacterium]|nr:trypsin-like peptidase domain-containing protein [Patescibacteria group bacterium]
MLNNILKIIAIFIIGSIGGIFADQILWPYFIERPLFLKYSLEQEPVYVTEKKEIFIQENIALTNAIEKTENSVVAISKKINNKKSLVGSGLIITRDGLIVTLSEIIPKDICFNIFINNDKQEIQNCKVLKRDNKNNLVLIKIEKNNLKTCGFFDFEKIKIGQRVFSIGAIQKLDNDKKYVFTPIVNQGIISYFNKEFIYTDISQKNNINSSILFDIEGKAVGINFLNKQGETITIPSNKIREFIGF